MSVDLSRFKDTFFDEAAEHVARIEQDLLALEGDGEPRLLLDAIFRAAHSIKGAAGVFGFSDLTDFTHVLESVLDRLRDGHLACDRPTVNLLLSADDVLKGLLDGARRGTALPEAMPGVVAALNRLLGAPMVSAVTAQSVAPSDDSTRLVTVRFGPSPDIFRQGLDPQVLLRELADLGRIDSIELSCAFPDDFDPESCYLTWTVGLDTAASVATVRDVFLFAEDGALLEVSATEPAAPGDVPAAPTAGAVATERRAGAERRQSNESTSLRVPTDKVDRLIDLVGELVISQSMVTTLADQATPNLIQLRDAVALLGRNIRELQERVLGIRMVPIGGTFSRFPRLVRDVASELQKSVRLELSGQETELDKGVVERLADPLTHLVRNAIDHGLEGPEARRAAGKAAEGTITLSARTHGGSVLISVADDGRGLDTVRIEEKAIAQGLIPSDHGLDAAGLHQLIFMAGFSTAAAVSDLSGRGVGMDVVKRDVEALKGAVSIDSRPGEGTAITIRLPLTVAILDGQIVTIGDSSFVLPLTAICESLRPKRNDLSVVLGQGEVVRVRGEAIPLVRLHRTLNIPARYEDPCHGIVVLVEDHGSRAALLVDDLAAQHQVVIKSLETHYTSVDGVMGVTIMGDGTVALILDVPGLVRMARHSHRAGVDDASAAA